MLSVTKKLISENLTERNNIKKKDDFDLTGKIGHTFNKRRIKFIKCDLSIIK